MPPLTIAEVFDMGLAGKPVGDAGIDVARDFLMTKPFCDEVKLAADWAVGAGFVLPTSTSWKHSISDSTPLNSLEWHTLKRQEMGQWSPTATPPDYDADRKVAASKAFRFAVKQDGELHSLVGVATISSANASGRMIRDGGNTPNRHVVVIGNVIDEWVCSCYLIATDLPNRGNGWKVLKP